MSSDNKAGGVKQFTTYLQEFSIPLILGVVVAMVLANLSPEIYASILHWKPLGHLLLLGHPLDLHFIINDIFMVFFFGIAAKEITEACLPNGSLNPVKKAINPLIATLGGVFGPVFVYFIGVWVLTSGVLGFQSPDTIARGWGIPTATDIALAWLVARLVFGKGHPAVDFLLLLAVADDAIGLGIIAIFYGDPSSPARPEFLALVLVAMGLAFALRKKNVQSWPLYIFLAGPLAWLGLFLAHMHPSLALVFIVPFLPAPKSDTGLFRNEDEVDLQHAGAEHHSPLHLFEHHTKAFVDFGLFFFALCNAGVAMGSVGALSALILIALVVGKTLGITAFAMFAAKIGFPLPEGMSLGDLVMAGFIAALGLTVALFVSGVAFVDAALIAEAKMGALMSGGTGLVAVAIRYLRSGAKETSSQQQATTPNVPANSPASA